MNILAMCPNPEDATSFYRGVGPLGALKKEIKSLNGSFYDSVEWTHLATCDILFVQRPFLPDHLHAIELAKDMHVPIWLDFDDDLFSISLDNPAFDTFYNARETIQKCIELSDVITCTTAALRETLGPKARIIPNAWNDYLFPFPKEFKPRERGFFWRGGTSHMSDMQSVIDPLRKAHEKYPDREWNFLGAKPWPIFSAIPDSSKVKLHLPMPLITYFKRLSDFNLELAIFPLMDSPFNWCKSNIAWLEATYAGMPIVCRDWPSWPGPSCAFTYATADDFFKGVVYALESSKLGDTCHRNSVDLVNEKYLLSDVNEDRKALLEEFVK